jgi:carboxymethylenebutenolidase
LRTGPGILVLHAWWGLNPFIRTLCDRLAREGFVVAAPDLYHGAIATTVQEAEMRSAEAKPEVIRADLFRALDDLRRLSATKSFGVVGLSFGADWALWLACARPEDIAAVVTFYGGHEEDYGKARAAFQCHFASEDPFVPPEERRNLEDRLRAAEREAEFHDYAGTKHWFFEKDRPEAYDEVAASQVWRRTLGFLRDHVTR